MKATDNKTTELHYCFKCTQTTNCIEGECQKCGSIDNRDNGEIIAHVVAESTKIEEKYEALKSAYDKLHLAASKIVEVTENRQPEKFFDAYQKLKELAV